MVGDGQRPRWMWALLGLAVVVHLAFLISLHTRSLNPAFNDARNRPGPGADWFAVYHGGRQIVTHRDPYERAESPRVTPDVFAPYRYPPAVALTVGAVVAHFEPWPTYYGWVVVLELLLLANLWLVRRIVAVPRHRDWLTAGWLAFTPWYLELWMGQFTMVTATLVLCAHLAWESGRGRRAAIWWACASVIKLFPLALAPLLIRQRRFAALAFGGAAVAAAMLWFAWNPRAWETFYRLNFTEVDLLSFHAGNFGLQAFVYELLRLVHDPSAAQWRPIALGLSVVLIASATLAMTVRADADRRVSVAIALMLLPLLSKHVWEHHYVVALPALTLLTAAWCDRPRRLVGLACAYALLCMPSLLLVLQSGSATWYPSRVWSQATTVLYHAVKPLTVLSLYGFCVVIQIRECASREDRARV